MTQPGPRSARSERSGRRPVETWHGLPRWLWWFIAAGVVLLVVFLAVHLLGGGLAGMHG